MTGPERHVQKALNHALDAQAANHHEERMLFDPSPEMDSLMEYILGLPMPDQTRRVLLAKAQLVLEQNRLERDCERNIAGHLDGVVKRANCPGVKELAPKLARMLKAEHTGGYVSLVCHVRDLCRSPFVGPGILMSDSMRAQLGDGPGGRLRELVVLVEAC